MSITVYTMPVKYKGDLIKLLLSYLKQNFQSVATGGEGWANQAKEFTQNGFEFPNLPMIVDGDLKLSETSAILFYLSEKFGDGSLTGKTLADKAQVRLVEGVLADLFDNLGKCIFTPEYKEKMKGELEEGSATTKGIKRLEAFLGQKNYFLGYLTYVDFILANFYWMLQDFYKSAGLANPLARRNLWKLTQRVYALDGVKQWVAGANGGPGKAYLLVKIKSKIFFKFFFNFSNFFS